MKWAILYSVIHENNMKVSTSKEKALLKDLAMAVT
jgi:hypothetical protein